MAKNISCALEKISESYGRLHLYLNCHEPNGHPADASFYNSIEMLNLVEQERRYIPFNIVKIVDDECRFFFAETDSNYKPLSKKELTGILKEAELLNVKYSNGKTKNVSNNFNFPRNLEEEVFRSMHYCKSRASSIAEKIIATRRYSKNQLDTMLKSHEISLIAQQVVVCNNRGLVYSIIQKESLDPREFSDVADESLIRASLKFDFRRGFRFSTYACNAIRNGILRELELRQRYATLPSEYVEQYKLNFNRIPDRLQEDKPEMINLISIALGKNKSVGGLTAKEKIILKLRFGIDNGQGKTLRDVAKELCLTKERIRQLQARALGKLRRELNRSF